MLSFPIGSGSIPNFYAEVRKHGNANQESGGGLPGNPSREEANQRQGQTLRPEPTGVSAGCRTESAHQGRVQTAYLQELTAALGRTYEAVSTLAEKGPVIYHGNL